MKKVTIVGAGKYGSMTALRVAEYDLVDSVVMTDIVDGLPQGLALDMNQSRYVENFSSKIIGTNDYEDTADSDVVVITAGLPRKPGMTRMDLLEVNANIVSDVTKNILNFSKSPIIIVVTNPLDQMTMLVSQVSGLPKNKVIGQAGVLDTSRFAYFISEKFNVNMNEIEALTLGRPGIESDDSSKCSALDSETRPSLLWFNSSARTSSRNCAARFRSRDVSAVDKEEF